MKKSKQLFQVISTPLLFTVCLSITLLCNNCSTPKFSISEYEFSYNNQSYLLKSAYCQDNPESCNQLIGDNFIAIDMNQDRIIDKITKGKISLAEAQEIYDYCLASLEKEGKLNEVNRDNKSFVFNDSEYNYEIKSFHPDLNSAFNEFYITDKKNGPNYSKTSVLIDHNADGKLDELLKGGILTDGAQSHYNKVIEIGLKQEKLIKINSLIVVK